MKVSHAAWDDFEAAVEVHVGAPLIGGLLFQILDNAGYDADEVQAVANTLLTYVD